MRLAASLCTLRPARRRYRTQHSLPDGVVSPCRVGTFTRGFLHQISRVSHPYVLLSIGLSLLDAPDSRFNFYIFPDHLRRMRMRTSKRCQYLRVFSNGSSHHLGKIFHEIQFRLTKQYPP